MAALNFEYPMVGYHFLVVFEVFPQTPVDARFREVSGLSVTMQTESIKEGGENRFTHKLPVRSSYSDVTLKRGLFNTALLTEWCRQAIENYDFKPVNVLITLQDENHVPVFGWYLINAYPTKWEVTGLNAESSQIAVESLTLSYNYFKIISPASLAAGIAGAISGSISVGI